MPNSYNGWPASSDPDAIGIVPFIVGGESFSPGVKGGDVHTVFTYLVEQLDKRVEPVVRSDWHQADDWGYNYRANVNNPDTLSCHASGTAIDYNATRHPNGQSNTFSAAQAMEIYKIINELGGVIRWLVGYDEMHFEIRGTAATVAAVALRLNTSTGSDDDMTPEQAQQLAELRAGQDKIRRDVREIGNMLNKLAAGIGSTHRLEILSAGTLDNKIES